MSDIQFCKQTAQTSNPFSDAKFAERCGICMTRGTVLSDPNPFSHISNTLGTGIVVYPEDKAFSLQQKIPANPSAHSAYCEPLVIHTIPSNVSPENITSVAINQQQYDDTTAYLKSLNTISLSDLSNCNSIRQTLTCSNSSTLSGINLTYGHFIDTCEPGSNVAVNTYITDSVGKQSYTLSKDLPPGQRQWMASAECTVNEEQIPPKLPRLTSRWVGSNQNALSNYFWADPFTSPQDIRNISIYGSVTLAKDTVVTIQYSTTAAFTMRLHGLNQYTNTTSTSIRSLKTNPKQYLITPSTTFTLYKGQNTIVLVMKGTADGNALAFSMNDLSGISVATLDSTWVYSISEGFSTNEVGFSTNEEGFSTNEEGFSNQTQTKRVVANGYSISSTPNNISALYVNPRVPVNFFNSFTFTSHQLCTLTVTATAPTPAPCQFTIYTIYNNIEKTIGSYSGSDGVAHVSYKEYFPIGTTAIRISISGKGDRVLIPIVYKMVYPQPETFDVTGPAYNYFARSNDAPAVCAIYNARQATSNDVYNSSQNGANWCSTGWVSDLPHAIYPITYDTMGGCGNGRTGVMMWDNGTAGVTCFGQKPSIEQGLSNNHKILSFNASLYNQQPVVTPDSQWMTDQLETFAVGAPGYFAQVSQAAAVCSKLGAVQATSNDVFTANGQGANWCFTGWVSDLPHAIYPITYDTMGGCGNGRSGVMMWDNGTAGVTCFGKKPTPDQASSNGYSILPFNKDTYFQS